MFGIGVTKFAGVACTAAFFKLFLGSISVLSCVVFSRRWAASILVAGGRAAMCILAWELPLRYHGAGQFVLLFKMLSYP